MTKQNRSPTGTTQVALVGVMPAVRTKRSADNGAWSAGGRAVAVGDQPLHGAPHNGGKATHSGQPVQLSHR